MSWRFGKSQIKAYFWRDFFSNKNFSEKKLGFVSCWSLKKNVVKNVVSHFWEKLFADPLTYWPADRDSFVGLFPPKDGFQKQRILLHENPL